MIRSFQKGNTCLCSSRGTKVTVCQSFKDLINCTKMEFWGTSNFGILYRCPFRYNIMLYLFVNLQSILVWSQAAKDVAPLNPKWAGLFGGSRSRGGLNQDALVFDVLYCYLSLKTCIQSLKLKFESSVVCRINDQHPSLSSFSVRPCRIYVLR